MKHVIGEAGGGSVRLTSIPVLFQHTIFPKAIRGSVSNIMIE